MHQEDPKDKMRRLLIGKELEEEGIQTQSHAAKHSSLKSIRILGKMKKNLAT